jgi:hypothetical protein
MPANAGPRTVRAVVGIACALLIAGCAGGTAESTAGSSPGATPVTTTTPEPTTTVPPLTAEEDAWLKAVSKLGKKYDNIVADSPTNWTAAVMAKLAGQMRGCGRHAGRSTRRSAASRAARASWSRSSAWTCGRRARSS